MKYAIITILSRFYACVPTTKGRVKCRRVTGDARLLPHGRKDLSKQVRLVGSPARESISRMPRGLPEKAVLDFFKKNQGSKGVKYALIFTPTPRQG